MYKHCNTKEAAERQLRLEKCLLDNLKTRRYDEISVSELCEQVGISRKSFYYYFGSKDGVLHALIDHAVLGCSFFSGSSSGQSGFPAHSAEQFFFYWKEQKPLLDALQANRLDNQLLLRIFYHVQNEEFDFRQRLQAVNSDCGMETVLFAVSGITALLLSWHRSGYLKPIPEMVKILERLLFQPLVSQTAESVSR